METAVLRRVREQIAKEKLLAQGSKAVVGLSGGSDSLCLLLLLRELSKELSLSLCAVHVNHGIRGEAADRDEAFCAAACGGFSLGEGQCSRARSRAGHGS